MIIKNPTESEISVQILGVKYTLPAKGELKGLPVEHAEYWVSRLHQFLEVISELNDAEITRKPTKEVVEEVKEIVEEEKTEESEVKTEDKSTKTTTKSDKK